MGMQKFGDSQPAEVLQGRQANVVRSYMERLGKYQVSEFGDEDREALAGELEEARKLDAEDEAERQKRADAAAKAAQTRAENQRKMEEDDEKLRKAEEKKNAKREEPASRGDKLPKSDSSANSE